MRPSTPHDLVLEIDAAYNEQGGLDLLGTITNISDDEVMISGMTSSLFNWSVKPLRIKDVEFTPVFGSAQATHHGTIAPGHCIPLQLTLPSADEVTQDHEDRYLGEDSIFELDSLTVITDGTEKEKAKDTFDCEECGETYDARDEINYCKQCGSELKDKEERTGPEGEEIIFDPTVDDTDFSRIVIKLTVNLGIQGQVSVSKVLYDEELQEMYLEPSEPIGELDVTVGAGPASAKNYLENL